MAGRAPSPALAEFAKSKGFTAEELARFEVRDGFDRIEIPYLTAQGEPYSRTRTRNGDRGFAWTPGDDPLIPYGLWRPVPYAHAFVVVNEGESDCWACWLGGIPALGVPGASAASVLHAAQFEGVKRVAVVQEPGEAGSRFPFRVAQRLRDTGFTGETFSITLGKHKDAREAFIAGRDTFTLRMQDAWRHRKLIVPESPQPQGPKFVSAAELLSRPRVAQDWLIEGLVPTGGPVLLVSKPKVGKSVFARNMAMAVATGSPFLDREVRQGPVLWLGFEESEAHVLNEFEALGLSAQSPIYFCLERAPRDALAWLQEAAKQFKPVLVVVDTWIHLTRVREINSYSEVSAANAPLVALAREHGAAMLWLHHANKAQVREDSVLGSNALLAASDVLIGLTADTSGQRSMWTRQRIGESMGDELLARDPQTGSVRLDGSRYAGAVRESAYRLLCILADCGPLERADLIRRLETRRQVAYAALRQKTSNGEVFVASGSGKRGEPYVYALTDAGKAAANSGSGGSASSGGSGSIGSPRPLTQVPVVPANVTHLRCLACGLLLNPRMLHPHGLCAACERK